MKAPRTEVRLARTLDDLMQVMTLRSAVYMAEQDCPYAEEFDGNDFCSGHLIGTIGGEPAGCIRARFFADFVKLERLAVLHRFRKSRLAFQLVRGGIDLARRKGFKRIYGHSQDRLMAFWAHFGAKPLEENRKLIFSDFSYTVMVIDLEPDPNAISIDSDPYMIIRPEGAWDEPGVLDQSADRAVSSPLRNLGA